MLNGARAAPPRSALIQHSPFNISHSTLLLPVRSSKPQPHSPRPLPSPTPDSTPDSPPLSLRKPRFVNPPPFRPVLCLVVRSRRILGAGDAGLRAEELGEDGRRDLKVLAVIGHIDPRAAGDEHTVDLPKHVRPDDAPLLLALSPPRVGGGCGD